MPHAINPSIYGKVPYDPIRDFTPISVIGVAPMFLFVNPSVKAQNVKEFIALAKAQPGKISFGSGSSSSRVAGEMFAGYLGSRDFIGCADGGLETVCSVQGAVLRVLAAVRVAA